MAQTQTEQRVAIEDVLQASTDSPLQKLLANQAFWVALAVILIAAVMSVISGPFTSANNLFNVFRNLSFIGIVALGMTAVIITAGIDLSVGSIMGLSGIITGLVLQAGYPALVGIGAGLATGIIIGLINGVLIAYLKLSPFVVTLGMLSIARSLALAFSNNRMIFDFGPQADLFIAIGGGTTFGLANPVIVLVLLALIFSFMLNFTAWGRHVYAIGGNEEAARLSGVPVDLIKTSVYVLSGLVAAIAAVLMVGWLGAVTNALGTTSELRVIAATVIGGANLLGGAGTAFGAVIGAVLIEVIRNSLLLAGVNPFWQGTFVGLFIIFAVLLERLRGRGSG
ncbi:MAG: ABC transporter permease [Alphaproteobacteria bacterium]